MIGSILVTGNVFADWLEKRYLTWQMENGRASIRKFSAWLEVDHALIIQMMNGKGRPGPKSLPKMAEKLGPEIFDVLELPRPESIEAELAAHYGVPLESKTEFISDTRKFIEQWFLTHGWMLENGEDSQNQDDSTPE